MRSRTTNAEPLFEDGRLETESQIVKASSAKLEPALQRTAPPPQLIVSVLPERSAPVYFPLTGGNARDGDVT